MEHLIDRLEEVLGKHCRLSTTPVAVRLAGKGELPPEKARFPLEHIGNRLAVCQAMTMVRTMGWSMAFRQEDHACPFPRIFMGHISADRFLEGTVAAYYVKDTDRMRAMEASYPRWPAGRYEQIWLAPLDSCDFEPDLVVAYGNTAQVLAMVHGANYAVGTGIESVSTGRFGCSSWIAGVAQSDKCTYVIPGPGERVFAGTQDHEMFFVLPRSRFDQFITGMHYVRAKRMYRYPVPKMGLMAEPRIPKNYREIEPKE